MKGEWGVGRVMHDGPEGRRREERDESSPGHLTVSEENVTI